MNKLFLVGLGGALGAIARYLVSLIPVKADFPLLTLLTNLLGAVLIGFLTGLLSVRGGKGEYMLFWRTGVCGGFTTFSTFSLEALNLLQQGKYGYGTAYIVLSVLLCLLGVFLGERLARAFFAA